MIIPVFVKLIGAAAGAILADSVVKAVNNKKDLQQSSQDDKPVTLESTKAKSMPKSGAKDDSKNSGETGGNRSDKRSDSGVSEQSSNENGELNNESDQ